ncbi:MAG: prolyl oligopeptidase family serine peptidase, partial [Tunicatimonas sp.]|uniref:prolyl oligopeptidase family serine peptidase n=1 Tax=Tunicatimonas sp. TaxID=1940096 RepID=UPI003C73597F
GLFFRLSNWNSGLKTYYYDAERQQVLLTNMRPSSPFESPKNLMVEEVLVASHDGEEVPLSIIYNKRVAKDGTNPTLLKAYGAYGESLEPYMELEMLAWYKKGGVLAVAHVRGGGEKGAAWHKAGQKGQKVNSWKDVIACAEYLTEKNYTSPNKLAAYSVSAGGLAVGKAMIERPELFKAVVLDYALLNPTRLDQSPNGLAQAEEFGSPRDSVEFANLLEMDPYLSFESSTNKDVPAVLLTAGRKDQRTLLWEPAKMAAILTDLRDNNHPTLLRVYDGGHGVNASEETLTTIADRMAFLLWQLSDTELVRQSEGE